MIQEYTTKCDNCKDVKVAKLDVPAKTSIFAFCGRKLHFKCILCDCETCTVVEPYLD